MFSVGPIDIDSTGSGSIKTNGGLLYMGGGTIYTQGGNIDGGGTANIDNFDQINANVKNFDIEHPTKKEPHRLKYSVLEGPEISVFVRGEIKDSNIIELPYYWRDLVHENSLTINLTAIGKPTIYYVEKIDDNKIYIGANEDNFNFYYTVFAERKDVDKLVVEYMKK